MLIEGPLTIGALDRPDGPGRELHLTFTPEFRRLDLARQGQAFRGYVAELHGRIESIPDGDDRNRRGMLIVLQIAEQLLPHIANGDMALEETIVVELGPEAGGLSVMDLLRGGGGGGT